MEYLKSCTATSGNKAELAAAFVQKNWTARQISRGPDQVPLFSLLDLTHWPLMSFVTFIRILVTS